MNELGLTPYADRRTRFLGLREFDSHTLKLYSVVYGTGVFDVERFEAGLERAGEELPPADPANGRPGAGFAILHQGATGDYLVLCWWDRENELPTRVFLRYDGEWRPAEAGESFCVWDLEIMWFERRTYVETVLAEKDASTASYLATHMSA